MLLIVGVHLCTKVNAHSLMDTSKKLIKKRIGNPELDSVAHRKKHLGAGKKDIRLLLRARNAWENLSEFREQRARNMRMAYGDQWGDYITVYVKGEKKVMTMREFLSRDGMVPVQANLIKSQVETVNGLIVKEQNEAVCNAIDREEQQYGELLTAGVQANSVKNKINLIYNLAVKDALLGGLAMAGEYYGYREGDKRREDSWTYYIDPNYIIMETTFRDPRIWDLTMIGRWYRTSFNEIVAKFAKSPETYKKLKDIYPNGVGPNDEGDILEITQVNDLHNLEFMHNIKLNDCCVAEIWTLETKERVWVHDYNEGTLDVIDADNTETINSIEKINKERIAFGKAKGWSEDEIPLIELQYFVDQFWYCRFLAPDGTILWEEESPYPDRSHPFTVLAIPFIDGRISGYFSDAVDSQIGYNRALVLQDWMARNQIKGFTMIPQQLVPDEMENEEFVQESLNMGNFFFYDADKAHGLKPEVFHAGTTNYDIGALLATYKQNIEASTAVSGALQGKTPYSGTSAALYAQQTANSSTPLASLLSDLRAFMESVATKKAKNLAAFYDQRRWEQIVGSMASWFGNKNLNLNKIEDLEFDVIVRESGETPVARDIANDQLLSFLQAGMIDLDTMLSVGHFPYGDQLLQMMHARQAEAQAIQEQVNAGGVPEAVAKDMDNPQESKGYGLEVQSTRPIVQ